MAPATKIASVHSANGQTQFELGRDGAPPAESLLTARRGCQHHDQPFFWLVKLPLGFCELCSRHLGSENSPSPVDTAVAFATKPLLKASAPMSTVLASVKRFLRSEDGPTAVEYAIMLSMILVVCIPAVMNIGQTNNSNMQTINAAMK